MTGMPPFITLTPTATITPLPQTTYSYLINNVTQSHMNLVQLPGNIMAPYGFVTTGGLAIPFFICFLAYFYSLWLSHGNLRMASIVGLMFGGMFLFTTGGLGIGLPDPIAPLAYGALCASISGYVMSMFKNA
jgi:hypothetical protein